jgi:hypothetical protein
MTIYIEDFDIAIVAMNLIGFFLAVIWLIMESLLTLAVWSQETLDIAYVFSGLANVCFFTGMIVLVFINVWWVKKAHLEKQRWL